MDVVTLFWDQARALRTWRQPGQGPTAATSHRPMQLAVGEARVHLVPPGPGRGEQGPGGGRAVLPAPGAALPARVALPVHAALPAHVTLGATLRDLQALVVVDGPLLPSCAARLDQVLRGDCGRQHMQSHHPTGRCTSEVSYVNKHSRGCWRPSRPQDQVGTPHDCCACRPPAAHSCSLPGRCSSPRGQGRGWEAQGQSLTGGRGQLRGALTLQSTLGDQHCPAPSCLVLLPPPQAVSRKEPPRAQEPQTQALLLRNPTQDTETDETQEDSNSGTGGLSPRGTVRADLL